MTTHQPSLDLLDHWALADTTVRDGLHDEALRHLADAPADVPLPAALGWRLGTLLHQRGEFDAADACYRRAAARIEDVAAAADRAQVLAGWAAVRWARGDRVQALQLADDAIRVARESRDDGALAAAYVAQALAALLRGDRAANEHAYARAMAAAERAGDVGQQLRIRCNVGSRLVEEGRYRAAAEELAEAIRVGESTGRRMLLALALHNRAEAWLGLGELHQARADAESSLTLWQRDGSPLAAFGLALTARVHRVRGATSQALAAYRAAEAMATPDGNAQVLVEACAGLARTYYAEDPAAAARYAQRAVALPSTAGPTPTIAELAAGWVALCSGDIQSAAGYAARVRAEAGRSRDAAGLAEAIELAALAAHRSQPQPAARGTLRRCLASLVEAAAIWAELGNEYALATNASLQARIGGDQLAEDIAAQRLLDLGVQEGAWHMAGPLAVIGPTAIEVEVRTLGHFEVRLAGVPIPAATWQSRKARDLLKLLSGQLGRPAGRDTLAATLWPDAPHEVGMRRLSVLISTVRGLLDPARRHPADRYLITEPSTVQINQAHVVLDAARFAEAARAAIAAEGARLVADRRPPDRPSPAGAWPPADSGARQDADRRLLAGLEAVAARYTGDFCDDGELTGDVIDRSRAALADLFREAVRRLAHRYVQLGRPEAAIGWYLRLTAADRYDEQAHLGLIGALSASGRHGEAARRYRDYLGRMDEIDVKPVAFPLIQPGTAGSPKNS